MLILNNITKFEFYQIRKKRIPTLIKNGLNDFPLIKKWNKDYIKKVHDTNYVDNFYLQFL